MLAIKKSCEMLGGRARLANRLGVTRQAVSQWCRGVDPVPLRRCIEIEGLTKGRVTCEELRPDIDWHVLRRGGGALEAAA